MKQTRTDVQDLAPFANALCLYPTVEAVVEHNVTKLKDSGQPIATTKAIHTGANAAGLVNGAMGTIEAICYRNRGPPDLPIAVMVKFDHYNGPTLHDGTVPIIPIRHTWSNSGVQCSRLQLPLKLAWAVTIHKSQGLTLDKVVINVGKKEFSVG